MLLGKKETTIISLLVKEMDANKDNKLKGRGKVHKRFHQN
jgi:hypothetical protein